VGLDDFTEEVSAESLLKVLALHRDLSKTMDAFDRSAVTVLREYGLSLPEIESRLSLTHEGVWQITGSTDAEQCLANLMGAGVTPSGDAPKKGSIYTRDNLRALFEIRDATLNNGVFHFTNRREVWLFVTENKQADREQYVDKLVGDTLHWQGQKMGRTDALIIDHGQIGESLLIFYRRAKYEFDGAGFRCEGAFEYVSHSGSRPADFVLRRVAP
jgi:hypothetical protein